jgi:hypothetical protein
MLKTLFKLSLVFIASRLGLFPKTLLLVVFPRAFISSVAVDKLNSLALPLAISPFTVIIATVFERVLSLPVPFIILPLTLVLRAVLSKVVCSKAFFHLIYEISLIFVSIFVGVECISSEFTLDELPLAFSSFFG